MQILLLVVFALSCVGLCAQQPAFKATRLTVQDGLSDNMVLCALQDRRGFLWFGTRNGLNRYDGYRITAFYHDKNNPYSLSDDPVHSLLEDSRGRLWVGTGEGGLNLFDPITERFAHYKHEPGNPHSIFPGVILSLCEDTSGCLWIVTDNTNRGVQKFDPARGRCTAYRHSENNPYSISSDMVRSVCRDSTGAIWLVTRTHGLNRYDPARDGFVNYRTLPDYRLPMSRMLYRVFAARDGGLWVSDSTTSVWNVRVRGDRLDASKLQLGKGSSAYDDVVTSIAEGVGSRLWIGTQGGGFFIVDRKSGVSTRVANTGSEPYSLASNQVFMLYPDHYGDMWICTDMGMHRFYRLTNYIQHFSHNPLNPTAVSYPKVRSLLCSGSKLLIGTGGGGLDISEHERLRHYNNRCIVPLDMGCNTLNTLYQTRDNTVWVGTNNGLFTVDPATGRFFRQPYAVLGPRVWAICEDAEGMLWVGTLFTGLTRIDRNTGETRYYFADIMAQKSGTPVSVHTVYEDRRHNLWIGTNNGLYRIDRATDKPVWVASNSASQRSLSHNHIWYIHEARDGKLWLGTAGGGLNLFDPTTGRCTRYGREQGLPSDIICGILEDERGDLWVSTNTGIFRFSPATGHSVAYGIDDGMYISEFHFKTCFRNSGIMYFGGTGGYVRFHPDSLRADRPHRMIFTSFNVFDRRLALDTAISLKKHVVLSHDSNFFSVEFAALDFAGAHHHRYRYRLEGYDKQWQHTDGTRPFAGYTDVPPGNYKLVVEVEKAPGSREAIHAALDISVMPAWWQTLWFRGAVMLCIVGVGIGALQWYVRSVRRRSATERRLVELQLESLRAQMNPHFIFNSLTSIYYYIMSRDDEKAQTYLGLFSMLLRHILEYSRQTVIPISKEIEILEMYLELEAMRFSRRFSYTISVSPSIDAEQQLMPTMLLQPYVENAIKHGLLPKEHDCVLAIEFSRNDGRIECSITDNGIGREQSGIRREQSQLRHTSKGLALSQERLSNLSELHGKLYGVEVQDLTTESGEAAGTRIVLTFPADTTGRAEPLPQLSGYATTKYHT